MKRLVGFIFVTAVVFFAPASLAQSPEQAEYPRFTQAELDQMLAPIALYPDSLLSQLLIAVTYSRDVAEAAAWSRANPQLRGDEAVRAVANEPWDPSVKSLVAFPQVLAMLDERMDWTERLGDAFMAQPEQVSETIQVLRGRADRAGNLRSGEEIVVRRDYDNYVIEPAQPEVVYVPYYDPRVVYGTWWWRDYEPVWWSPWAGYSWNSGYAFGWGYGIHLGSRFWFSSFDWPRRYIRFHGHRPHYYHGQSRWHGHRWSSDRDHRRNIRGWHGSPDRRYGGRRDAQWDGRRDGYAGRRDGRRDGGDGRDWRRDGRRDGRDGRREGRDGRSERRAEAERSPALGSGIERLESPRYAAPAAAASPAERRAAPRVMPAAPVQRGYGNSQPPARAIERMPERSYVPRPSQAAPQLAPASPISRPMERQASRPVERQAAPERQARPAPSARQESRAESRSEFHSESRSEGSRGGGSHLGRSGGRAQQQ